MSNHCDTNSRFSPEAAQVGKSAPVVIPVLVFVRSFFYARCQPTLVKSPDEVLATGYW